MENTVSPVPYIAKRELGLIQDIKSHYFNKRLHVAKSLYRRELVCHYGCVNAIEFSSNGELLVSGGDDRRVMLWKFGEAILDMGKPEPMAESHQSNIFCLGITSDNQKVYSGGNDNMVKVHDVESTCPVEMLEHQGAVSGLSINPFNEMVVATAGTDGRLLLFDTRHSDHESLVISRSRKVFHAVMFHPLQPDMLVSANARDGVALWDLRSPKHPVLRYLGNNGHCQNSMSVKFNSTGNLILALRRRQTPVLYNTDSAEPIAEFYHQDYHNSCTMKSCCFAGEGDRFVVSGSDDFNLYMWKVPDGAVPVDNLVEPTHLVLYGHRSIVNQVRYNPQYCAIASSGVEKVIKVWSTVDYPKMRGSLMTEAIGSDNPREIYSHEDYVSLVHHSAQFMISINAQTTNEDPRMMAFFDSLVQREHECVAEETDSLDGSSSGPATIFSDNQQQLVVNVLSNCGPLPPPKIRRSNGSRQRCTNRLARLVASRNAKSFRSQKRGTLRRVKQSRTLKCNPPCVSGPSVKGKRLSRVPRRPPPRPSAPSSERTDSDEPHCRFRTTKIIRPLRRRMNLTRSSKRKIKVPVYRKSNSRINGGNHNNNDSNFSQFDNYEDNLSLPSTSTGYRGQTTSSLFRIAEVDSDDDQSPISQPVSPRTNHIPPYLIGIIPTPINGYRDHISPPQVDRLRTNLRRLRRNRPSINRSDSSESGKDVKAKISHNNHNNTVENLKNETNESEVESSCSDGIWSQSGDGPSTSRGLPRPENTSDDPEYPPHKFRQRPKKSRRNYRSHIDSDSN